jgi:hypothetical protein
MLRTFLFGAILLVAFIDAGDVIPNCKHTTLGKEYFGKISETKSGKKCQAWVSQSPQTHKVFTPSDFPAGESETLARNFCRNPDNSADGPWCYTTDKDTRWEYCDILMCPNCKTTVLGKEYIGQRTQTKTGKTCQAWTSQSPQEHKVFTEFPDGSAAMAKNYCRNPDDSTDGPWCYTTDKSTRWEYCDVSVCPKCKATMLGKEYQGDASKTKTGKTCQAWTSQSPQEHKVFTQFPDGSAALAKNFCRNPDNSASGPWCYTTDKNTRWEYCTVPACHA